MEYAYPPTSPLRPIPIDYANLGLIILCMLTAIVFIIYYRNAKQLWLVSLFLAFPVIGGTLPLLLKSSNPALPPDHRILLLLLALASLGLFLSLVRGVGLGRACAILLFGGLLLLIVPARQQAGGAARRTLCLNHLHNLAVAVMNFAGNNEGSFPPPGAQRDDLSWRVSILPLMDQAALYHAYHLDKPWDDPANDEFARIRIRSYQCTANLIQHDAQGRYYTAYAYFTGPGTAFDGDGSISLHRMAMADGLTHTLLLGEACGANIVWSEPRDIDVGTLPAGVNLPGTSPGTSAGWLSSYHNDSANVAFADGSARTISKNIDPQVLKALTTVFGNDTPPKNSW